MFMAKVFRNLKLKVLYKHMKVEVSFKHLFHELSLIIIIHVYIVTLLKGHRTFHILDHNCEFSNIYS